MCLEIFRVSPPSCFHLPKPKETTYRATTVVPQFLTSLPAAGRWRRCVFGGRVHRAAESRWWLDARPRQHEADAAQRKTKQQTRRARARTSPAWYSACVSPPRRLAGEGYVCSDTVLSIETMIRCKQWKPKSRGRLGLLICSNFWTRCRPRRMSCSQAN